MNFENHQSWNGDGNYFGNPHFGIAGDLCEFNYPMAAGYVGGSDCDDVIVNYDVHGSAIKDAINEYKAENCTACEGYEYEPCLEPVSEPPSCIDGQCGL